MKAGRKNCLWLEVGGANELFVWNSKASEKLWVDHRDRPSEVLVGAPAIDATPRRHADYPGCHIEGYPNTFKQLFCAFYDFIATGDQAAQPPFSTFADGHREVLICEAVLRSAHA